MTSGRKLVAALLLGLMTLSFFATPSSAAVSTQTVTILGGVIDETHALGSEDLYTETSTDGGVTWHPAYLVGEHPWGFVEGTNSWLNCGPSLEDCLGQTSLYRYRFHVPDTYSSPTLDAAFIVDNLGVITLNGTEISPGQVAGNWNTGGPIDVASMLHSGWNELQVTLVDQGGLAGINYRLVLSLQAAEEVIVAPRGSEPIQVSYNANGGSVSKLSDLYNIGDPGFNLPTPQRLGMIFLGWFTDPVEGQQVWDTNYVPASTSTLYAHWSDPGISAFELANTGGNVTWPLVAGLSCISVGLVLALRRRQN